MAKHIKAAVQHQHATRQQQAALESLVEESRARVPADEPPTSYVRVRSITSGPMGPALAAINLTAARHSGSDREDTLRALAEALGEVEAEMRFGDESRGLVRNEDGLLVEEDGPNSMCSKIPFVEMLFEEAQRVDGASLRLLLNYIGDVARAFETRLANSDRDGWGLN